MYHLTYKDYKYGTKAPNVLNYVPNSSLIDRKYGVQFKLFFIFLSYSRHLTTHSFFGI